MKKLICSNLDKFHNLTVMLRKPHEHATSRRILKDTEICTAKMGFTDENRLEMCLHRN